MKLIIGLGNPGDKYKKTRHNIGFEIIDFFVKDKNIKWKENFNSKYCDFVFEGEKVIVAKPMTYMNLSGDAVQKLASYFKIDNDNILVIHDDKDIQLGKIKYQLSGSSGGQNGVKDIISKLASENFCRMRIGIGQQQMNVIIDYVLGKFTKDELTKIDFSKAVDSIKYFIKNNIVLTMNKYN